MAATLLFLLSAVRGCDVRDWLGERVSRTLEGAGRGELVARLGSEMSAVARQASDPALGDWRSHALPILHDGHLTLVAFHARRGGDEGAAAGDRDVGRRFLIDLALSRLGALQLDGLVKDRRFDLTIRSQTAFPPAMREDLRALFRRACDATALKGGLTFQPGGHDWVAITARRGGAAARPDGIVA